MALRWITYRTDQGHLHQVRADLMEAKVGDEGYVSSDVIGVDAPLIYRHWENAVPEKVSTAWTLIDDEDREYLVRSIREINIMLGRRMLEVEAVQHRENRRFAC